MDVTTAVLCDFASARDGLLTVVSGCVTRLRPAGFPGQLGVMLALALEPSDDDFGVDHAVVVRVRRTDAEGPVAELGGSFKVELGEETPIRPPAPLVIDLRGVPVSAPGVYSVEVELDDTLRRTLPFLVEPRPQPEGEAPPQ
jgi:hypothetical protein